MCGTGAFKRMGVTERTFFDALKDRKGPDEVCPIEKSKDDYHLLDLYVLRCIKTFLQVWS